MTTTPKESVNERYLVTAAKARGLIAVKFTAPSTAGVPDRIGMGHGHDGAGRTLYVELKRPGGTATPRQIAVIDRMRRCGQHVEIVDNVVAIDAVLDHHFADHGGAATVPLIDHRRPRRTAARLRPADPTPKDAP